jgi:hypothetical protein
MLEIRRFEIDDFKELAKNATDKTVIEADEKTLLENAVINKNYGPAFTGLYDGKPICAGGILLRKGNSGRPWLLFTKEAAAHKKTVLRSLKKILDILVETNGLKKLFTELRIGLPESQRLLEHLGFKKQRRGFNNDYYLYKKVI